MHAVKQDHKIKEVGEGGAAADKRPDRQRISKTRGSIKFPFRHLQPGGRVQGGILSRPAGTPRKLPLRSPQALLLYSQRQIRTQHAHLHILYQLPPGVLDFRLECAQPPPRHYFLHDQQRSQLWVQERHSGGEAKISRSQLTIQSKEPQVQGTLLGPAPDGQPTHPHQNIGPVQFTRNRIIKQNRKSIPAPAKRPRTATAERSAKTAPKLKQAMEDSGCHRPPNSFDHLLPGLEVIYFQSAL